MMRRKPWLLFGLGTVLLIPAYGLTQIPSGPGGSSGKGKGDYRSRFGGGAVPGSTPGTPVPSPFSKSAPPGTPGSDSPFGRGSSGRGSEGSGGPSGEVPDNAKLFYTFSQGRETLRREDLPPPMQMLFDRSAQQLGISNGQMSKAQFEAMMQGVAAMRQNMQSPDGQTRMGEDFFRRQDRNGDGLLNFDEMSDALKDERDKWDMNRDGFIDVGEYNSYFQGRMQQRQQERNDQGGTGLYLPPPPRDEDPPRPEEEPKPVVYRAGKLPKEMPGWFTQLDTDADAQIGLYEWKTSGKSLEEFRGFDVNDDGFVTVAEVLRVNNQNAKASTAVASSGSAGSRPSGSGGSNSGLGNIFGMFGRRSGSGPGSPPTSGGGTPDTSRGGKSSR